MAFFLDKKMTHSENSHVSLLRRKSVEARTGLPRSSMYSLIAKGDFPKPVRTFGKAVAWCSTDIDAWISSRIAAA